MNAFEELVKAEVRKFRHEEQMRFACRMHWSFWGTHCGPALAMVHGNPKLQGLRETI